jgi:hypothetical protein
MQRSLRAATAENRIDLLLRWLAAAGVTLTLAMAVAAALLGRASEQGFLPLSFAIHSAQRPITLITTCTIAIMGGLLAWRMPRHLLGWVWILFAFAWVFIEFSRWAVAYSRFAIGPDVPAFEVIAWLAQPMWAIAVVAIVFVLLLYPTGRLPSPEWRPFAWVVVLAMAIAMLSLAFLPGMMEVVSYTNPMPWMPPSWVAGARALGDLLVALVFLGMFVAAASVFWRLRAARGVERQQVKWFAFAGLLTGLYFLFSPLLALLLRRQYWLDVTSALVLLALALSVMLAVLRYRLYDIDLFIRRTMVYSIVTALLAVLYLGTVILLQTFLVEATGRRSQAALVVSTLAIAALFNPVRLRVQEAIDGHFFRRRYDAQQVLDSFSQVARDETDLEVLANELAGVVQATMQPTAVHVWLADGGAQVEAEGRAAAHATPAVGRNQI